MKKHVHEKKKPYKCLVCEKVLLKKGHLKLHYATFHKEKTTLKIEPKVGLFINKNQKKQPKSRKVLSRIFYCSKCEKECCRQRDFKGERNDRMALKWHDELAHKCSRCTKKKKNRNKKNQTKRTKKPN